MATRNSLTVERLRELLHYDPDTGFFIRRVILSTNGTSKTTVGGWHSNGYRIINVDGKPYLAHRLAWLYFHSNWPSTYIDHKNHRKDDNRINNLRLASKKENGRHCLRYLTNTSGIPGVSWHKASKLWRATITVNKKQIHLGTFTSKTYAAAVRREAEIRYFGAFVSHASAEQR